MSHNKLRTEKNCLNCGAHVEEQYCPQCGQENIELHDSTWHLLAHYVQDLFHYDGKTWHTLRNLIRKPGLVALDYLEGKRKKNIEPIRLYVFMSTVFFILLFYMVRPGHQAGTANPITELNKRKYALSKEKEFLTGQPDTIQINVLLESLDKAIDSIRLTGGDTTGSDLELNLGNFASNHPDSAGWFEKIFLKRTEERRRELEEKHQGDMGEAMVDFSEEFFHKLPQLIFLSLPFYALFLKMLYFRPKKRLLVEHLIFSIYQYSYLYAVLIAYLLLAFVKNKINNGGVDTVFGYLAGLMVFYLFVYPLLAMKRFYQDRWRYLLPRYFILMFIMLIVILLLFLILALITYLL